MAGKNDERKATQFDLTTGRTGQEKEEGGLRCEKNRGIDCFQIGF
ncbi:hypothetical protein COLO4_11267 [Corchorus olitorius]|uniref:Uncharacterized protein n=1 Tax=Corchorus olitorius TaxID=93759 RepID=A0A1R3K576_9ROSI|nr:hypothetical protein COLO4_11267 [Corchorus olitorius]